MMENHIKVKVRKKKSNDSKDTVYFDIYPPVKNPYTNELSRRVFLGMWLHSEAQTKEQKTENATKLIFAEQMRSQIEVQIMKNDFTFFKGTEKPKLNFDTFFKEKKAVFENNVSCAMAAKLTAFIELKEKKMKRMVNFEHITPNFCTEFKQFLLKSLRQNTASVYFVKFKTLLLKEAVKKKYLTLDLEDIKQIKIIETGKEYLTEEEIKQLEQTEIHTGYEVLKQASFFAIYTGLRFSDVKELTWHEIEKNKEGYIIKFRQKKSKGFEYLPISKKAYSFCGEKGQDTDIVFKGLREMNQMTKDKYLRLWVALAGIHKKITFHNFRHTYATSLLDNGIDLFTVSKMLGHKDITTTQIYAKINDRAKRNAANTFDL